MKKFATIAIIALAGTMILPSCKKDYTCTCTIPGASPEKVSTPLNGYKKKDAKNACDQSSAAAAILGGNCSLD